MFATTTTISVGYGPAAPYAMVCLVVVWILGGLIVDRTRD